MKVGSLVQHKGTRHVSIVTWVHDYNGSHFKVWGYPKNQVFTSVSWEVLSESR